MEDLYDEFGNFIGDAEESEEEEQMDTTADAYLQDEEDENEAEANNQQLMHLDGEERHRLMMCCID
jgi:U5 small nuclear ribonucleoprotein component